MTSLLTLHISYICQGLFTFTAQSIHLHLHLTTLPSIFLFSGSWEQGKKASTWTSSSSNHFFFPSRFVRTKTMKKHYKSSSCKASSFKNLSSLPSPCLILTTKSLKTILVQLVEHFHAHPTGSFSESRIMRFIYDVHNLVTYPMDILVYNYILSRVFLIK